MRQLLRGKSDTWITIRAVVGILLLSTVMILNLISVLGHSSDINAIKKSTGVTETAVNKLKATSKARGKQNRTLAKDLVIVSKYAAGLKNEVAQLKGEVESNHNIGDGNFTAICRSIPGCVLPTVTTTPVTTP